MNDNATRRGNRVLRTFWAITIFAQRKFYDNSSRKLIHLSYFVLKVNYYGNLRGSLASLIKYGDFLPNTEQYVTAIPHEWMCIDNTQRYSKPT